MHYKRGFLGLVTFSQEQANTTVCSGDELRDELINELINSDNWQLLE